ncbi:hypothetical protein JW872_00210 [Candidatus Babeliales bacterium]|nr:hypothetical protein [Candidatus Babeliales bacterium]
MKKFFFIVSIAYTGGVAYGGIIGGIESAVTSVNATKSAIQTKVDQAKTGISNVKAQLDPAKEKLEAQLLVLQNKKPQLAEVKANAQDPETVDVAHQLYEWHFTSVNLSRTLEKIVELSDNLTTIIDQGVALIDPITTKHIPDMIPSMDRILSDLDQTKNRGVLGCNTAKSTLNSWKNAIKPYADALATVGIHI